MRLFAGRLEGEDAGGLRQRFHDQHAGHYRVVREMAGEVRLVESDVLVGMDRLAEFHRHHTVHQEEGVAVRQVLHDILDIH
jgi:hypothetical protein